MNTHSFSSEREKEAKILILITCEIAIGKCFPECFLGKKKCFLGPLSITKKPSQKKQIRKKAHILPKHPL